MTGRENETELRLFGEWRLLVDGQRVDVGRAQVRAALANLAVAERGLSADELIERLWGDRLPSDPRRALRVVISRCRAALGSAAEALRATDGTFALDLPTDIAAFLDLTEERDDAEAADVGDDVLAALALWDGGPIAELDDAALVARLERRRQAAWSRGIAALSAQGRHDEIIELAIETPLDQGLTGHRARALAAVGRKAEALDAIQASRSAQRDVGLEAADELVQLERLILDGAVDLAPTPASPRDELFIGREAELDALVEGAGVEMTVVIGEAGIGKSALLAAAAGRIREAGGVVHTIRGRASGSRVMEPIAELLTSELRGTGSLDDHEARALSVVCPDLAPGAGPWTSDRARLVEAVAGLVIRIVGGGTLCVDDLHDLDAMSTEVLDDLLRREACRVLGTTRPRPHQPFATADRIELAPLDEREIDDWVTKVLGPEAMDTAALNERTGGNALFVRLLLDAARAEQPTDAELPGTILAAVSAMVDRAGPTGRRLIDAAAVLAPVEVEIVTTLAGVDEAEIAPLVDLGLLHPVSAAAEVAFSHSLVAEACAQLQGPSARVGLNDAAAALHLERGSAPLAYWRHAVAASPVDPNRAFAAADAAAVEYAARFAWEPARAAAESALAAHTQAALAAPVEHLEGIVAEAMMLAGESGGDERLAAAVDAALAAGDAPTATHLTWRLASRSSYALLGLDVESIHRRIEQVMALDVDPRLRGRVQAVAARALAYSPFHAVGQQLFRDVASSLDDLGDPITRAVVLREGFQGASHPDDLELSERLGELLHQEQDERTEVPWIVPWIRFRNAMRRGDGAALRRARDEAAVAAREIEARPWSPVTVSIPMQQMWLDSSYRIVTGELDEAEAIADRSLLAFEELVADRGDQIGRAWATTIYGNLLLTIRSHQGRLAELAPLFAQSTSSVVALRAAGAAALHAAGENDRARDRLRELASDRFAAIIPDLAYTGAVWILAAPTAELLTADDIRALYEAIDRYRDQMSFTSATTLGPMQEALAVLADALGDDVAAREHRRAGVSLADAFRTAAARPSEADDG